MPRVILPLDVCKCVAEKCPAAERCARHLVEHAQWRPVSDFSTLDVFGSGCGHFMPVTPAEAERTARPVHPAPRGIAGLHEFDLRSLSSAMSPPPEASGFTPGASASGVSSSYGAPELARHSTPFNRA